MPAAYRVFAACEPLGACTSGHLSEDALSSRRDLENIRFARRPLISSARVRSGRVKAQFTILLAVIVSFMVSACSAWQTQENVLGQISTLENIRYTQLLTNLSNEIDREDSILSLGVTSSGIATSSLNGSAGFTLTQPFDFAHNTKTFSPSATVNWQNNWSITPISDPQDLANLRALYGLLYRNDSDIALVIKNTLILYNVAAGKVLDTHALVSKAYYDCGISWNPPEITNPENAMIAYLEALSAFPSSPSSPPSVSSDATAQKTNTSPQSKCYGDKGSGSGIINASLATFYGLAYPSKRAIFTSLRNGLSPDCRYYQIDNLIKTDQGKPTFIRNDRLFARWLFWQKGGNWQPANELPPEVLGTDGQPIPAKFENLGVYGKHAFWTPASACISDFIILAIHATANSHAAAQNSAKSGTTPTPLGGP